MLALCVLWLQLPPPNQLLPPQTQKPDFIASTVTFSQLQEPKLEQSSSSVTPGKLQPSKPALQKLQRSPQKVVATKGSPKTEAKTRLYTAPEIDIRVALAQNANGSAITSSTRTNILDANGRRVEQLLPGQAFQGVASNSTIVFSNWQFPSTMWLPADEGRSGIFERSLVQGEAITGSAGG